MKVIDVTYERYNGLGLEKVGAGKISVYEDLIELRLNSGDPYYAYQCAVEDVACSVGMLVQYDRVAISIRKGRKDIRLDVSSSIEPYARDSTSPHKAPKYRFSNSPRDVESTDWGAEDSFNDDFDDFF